MYARSIMITVRECCGRLLGLRSCEIMRPAEPVTDLRWECNLFDLIEE
jgi:hypothetical protein